MDWNRVIERNREALKRILATLVAMAGLRDWPISPLEGEMSGRTEGGVSSDGSLSLSAGGEGPTLSRRLHCAVLRILRPAESATRRLVIVAARGLVVELPPSRPPKPRPDLKATHAAMRRLGLAVVLSAADIARAAADRRAAARHAVLRAARPPVLPLFDPPRYPFRVRRRTVPPHAAPRILSFDGAAPHRLPPPPSPGDRVDATRLGRRIAALARALDDLPGHAMRFARWKARRDRDPGFSPVHGEGGPRSGGGCAAATGRRRRLWPLKVGRAPGFIRRSTHEVQEVLKDMQYFAREALKAPDTS